ncbi:type I-C CRISPR-associated protein Cas5c [Clostridium estertheticum]|uniref:type I-C CRISPR-associated protein Cas5c n=1 Tax=Clostridium estertheticum TaxID=238834 RepID=UPI001C7D67D1|nr:type I-C CRISPR-associated protein Cas5c [Clostridium estertheticum]MBX4261558.1 type I-C CRISPR-associated protein Cas5c [Clostridium estertheticum]WLC70942.1 type I-C CRISPR-associated protein Cas5c [Clostridium estertheticum]
MERENIVEFKVSGRYALFSDPINRIGGEKFSYQVPTYQALKGILESVYWKPTLIWIIDEVRVINLIKTQSQGIRPVNFSGGNTLSIYTYLANVEYQVRAHFEWNYNRPNLEQDRNENKHYLISKRMIKCGGRRDVFLGTRECQAYVEPCKFGEGEGAYDNYGSLSFGLMFHGFDYPDETGEDVLTARLWTPIMNNGYIKFRRPDECTIKRELSSMKPKVFDDNNFSGLKEFEKEGEIIELDTETL